MIYQPGTDLASERVVVAAPMSFTGSAERIWPITRGRAGWALAGMITLALLATAVAWALVLFWYAMWGIWLIPYRIIRRGQRKRHRDALRHAETIAAIERSGHLQTWAQDVSDDRPAIERRN